MPCIVRRISSSRPITSSSFPSRASAVISLPYLANASPGTAASGLTHGGGTGPCPLLPPNATE